jgi:2,5-diketo-D-gluconate reductase A
VDKVIVRWLTRRSVVAIPKSVKKERIRENFNIIDFELSNEDIEAIKTLGMSTSSFFDYRDPEIIKWMGA